MLPAVITEDLPTFPHSFNADVSIVTAHTPQIKITYFRDFIYSQFINISQFHPTLDTLCTKNATVKYTRNGEENQEGRASVEIRTTCLRNRRREYCLFGVSTTYMHN
jgi:hypothetical protein